MVVCVQIAPPDFDRMFGALADHTRRDIVRRAITAEEGVVELASHYPMSFAAVQKHVAVLERAGLVTKERTGRRKVVRTNLEALCSARRPLDPYAEVHPPPPQALTPPPPTARPVRGALARADRPHDRAHC
jgi:DNA-binding transcriptional ArsR family regulator